ncbi:MAG: DUF1428 domain-containing protein [Planctomycetes bacterium]|nr:DUF1428 domain-containing protein [Planctomycetota bacterium]
MPRYTDGFLIPLPTSKIAAYRRMATAAGKIWREHGALDFKECIGDDLDHPGVTAAFPKLLKLKPRETVVFSFIVFKSRAHRDRVNAAVMRDPRMAKMMAKQDMPFDCRRMAYGGFSVLVDG